MCFLPSFSSINKTKNEDKKNAHNLRRSTHGPSFYSLLSLLAFALSFSFTPASLPHLSTTQKIPTMTVDNPAVVFNTINNTLKQTESKDGLPVHETIVKVTSPLAYIDGVPYSSGEIWSNWANTLSATPERFFYPTTLEDLQVIIRQANANKKKVRCVATGHSWSGTAVTQDYMVSVNNMNRIEKPVKGEDGTWTVMIEMGVQVSALDEYLRKHDPPLALSSNVMPADVSCFLICSPLFFCKWP